MLKSVILRNLTANLVHILVKHDIDQSGRHFERSSTYERG